jgi:selenide,water dikinase
LHGGTLASASAASFFPLGSWNHSIDAPEPIFGLAVTGLLEKRHMKRNDTATAGCLLYLTKPLGIGILTTAEKKGKLRAADVGVARDWMCTLNKPGSRFGKLAGVTAMTDVTGFGLLGHLHEMAHGSGLAARIDARAVPELPGVRDLVAAGVVPGGTRRNLSYAERWVDFADDVTEGLAVPDGRQIVLDEHLECDVPVLSRGSLPE